MAGPVELAQVVLDFAPGAWVPLHNHPGLVAVTVIAGAVTLRAEGTETLYRPGESWVEVPGGRVHQAGNAGTAPAAVMFSFLLPKGAPFSTPHILASAPGAQTPPHTHPGQVFVTVLEGELTFLTGGVARVYRVGESFIEQPGVVGQAINRGSAPAATMVTYLVPQGAPLSTPVQGMPGLPATGAGGPGQPSVALWVLALAGGGLIAGSWRARRWPRRVP